MVLQSTGQIKLSEIYTEFGGTKPILLSKYYSNATSGYTSGVTGIPNIGSLIKLSNFYGKSKPSAFTWQFFNNSYCSSGEFASRSVLSKTTYTMQNILDNVINNPSYVAVYIYDGAQTPSNTWQISYISAANTVSLMYSRYGSMTPYEPNNRYIYVHIPRATTAGVYITKSYATLK